VRFPRAVTFDCAQTLVKVNATLPELVHRCAVMAGLALPPEAYLAYGKLYQERLAEYWEINRTRDARLGEAFWDSLTREWLLDIGQSAEKAKSLREASHAIAFGPNATLFEIYPDVAPCLTALRLRGVRLAVISNWDYTLHRTLETVGLGVAFDVVVASLEEGVEKPEPQLFEITLERLGVKANETVHVGDDVTDDVLGARKAGIYPVLLRRPGTETRAIDPAPATLSSLMDLPEALDWIA